MCAALIMENSETPSGEAFLSFVNYSWEPFVVTGGCYCYFQEFISYIQVEVYRILNTYRGFIMVFRD